MAGIQVFGAQGMLGGAVLRLLGFVPRDQLDPLAAVTVGGSPAVAKIDLTDYDAVARHLEQCMPSCAINCAAMTDVDGCETNRELAFRVNRDAARNLAKACAQVGAKCVYISTDFVFDGTKRQPYTEADTPNPQSIYALSKYEGELAVAEACADYIIARTAWLYGRGKRNFVERVLELAKQHPRLTGVVDQVGSPTYADDLADVLVKLAGGHHTGLFHATNSGGCSRLAWMREILKLAGIDKPIDPVPASRFRLPAARPAYSVLDGSRLRGALGAGLRPWQDALADYMRSRER
jgi:dTDP-4-dehydrorhamnose reductase